MVECLRVERIRDTTAARWGSKYVASTEAGTTPSVHPLGPEVTPAFFGRPARAERIPSEHPARSSCVSVACAVVVSVLD